MLDTPAFSLTVVGVDGTDPTDPSVAVNFCDRNGHVLLTAPTSFPPSTQTFNVQIASAIDPVYCQVRFSLYRTQQTGVFFPSPGSFNSGLVLAVRDPDKWRPTFTPLDFLNSPGFAELNRIIRVSGSVDFIDGPPLGDLRARYDAIAGSDQLLAKMCLLNLYNVLSSEVDPIAHSAWIGSVKSLHRLGQERFVAEVDPLVYESVSELLRGLALYQRIGFFPEPDASPHKKNFPAGYSIDEIISIKVRYDQGNLQLTPAKCRLNGQTVYLLDCDMDEDSNLIQHGGDMLAHVFSGGTHPIDIHEYIVADAAANAGGKASIELGYALKPSA